MSSSGVSSLAKYLLVRIVCPLRGYLASHPRSERDSPSDLLLGDEIQDVSIGSRVLIPTRFRERGGLWIDGGALPSPFLVLLPEGFYGILWKAKDGLDRRDESNGFVIIVLVVILAFVMVGTIDYLF